MAKEPKQLSPRNSEYRYYPPGTRQLRIGKVEIEDSRLSQSGLWDSGPIGNQTAGGPALNGRFDSLLRRMQSLLSQVAAKPSERDLHSEGDAHKTADRYPETGQHLDKHGWIGFRSADAMPTLRY
jgi:hypothetical protein